MDKKLAVILVSLLFLFSGCIGSSKQGVDKQSNNNHGGKGTTTKAVLDPVPSEESIAASKKLVADASSAFSSGDKEALMPLLSGALNESLKDADFSVPEAADLGKALSGAALIEKYPSLMVYEFDYGGRKQYFYTIKEGEEWKIDGL
jgi:hypothetical protein